MTPRAVAVLILITGLCAAIPAVCGAGTPSVDGAADPLFPGPTITVPIWLPDIALSTFVPPAGAVARTFTIRNSVQNADRGVAGPFATGFYLSTDTAITTSDVLIGTRSYSGLGMFEVAPEENTTVTIPAHVPAGTYYLGMIMDTGDTVAESDEENNTCCAPDTVSPLTPDLRWWSFGARGSQPRSFTVYNAVRNVGTDVVGPFSVGFYLSNDTAITTADTLIGTRVYSGLAAGEAGPDENTAVTVPSSVPGGTWYVGMIIDPADAVAELDEVNNVAWDPFGVTLAGLPDLAVWGFNPPSGLQPRTFTVYNAVKNAGDAPAGAFTAGFYLSGDAAITTADTLVGTRSYAGLAGGEAGAPEQTALSVPASIPAGTYYLGMIIDAADVVDERYEDNNVGTYPATITFIAPPAPDFAVWTFMPPRGPVGREFTIRNAVRNAGVAPAGPFTVGFYLSNDTALSASDPSIAERDVAGLLPGEATADENTTARVPEWVPAGVYYVLMVMDSSDAVAESNEDNNVVRDMSTVTLAGLPDLRIWTFIPPAGPVPRTFTILNAVQNGGDGPAGPFTVGFYLSNDTALSPSDTLIGNRTCTGLAAG
jgi:serralysin